MWEFILVGLTRIRLDAEERRENDFNAKTPSPARFAKWLWDGWSAEHNPLARVFPNWVMLAEPYAFS